MGWVDLENASKLPRTKQKTSNCCWAACGSAVSHYYYNNKGKGDQKSDADIATGIDKDISRTASIEDVLVYIGCATKGSIQVDDHNLPTNKEIAIEMQAGRPLVVGIHQNPLRDPKRDQLKDGHYMVIIGVDDTTNKLKLMDPSVGNQVEAGRDKYDQNSYHDYHYCKTFYTDCPK